MNPKNLNAHCRHRLKGTFISLTSGLSVWNWLEMRTPPQQFLISVLLKLITEADSRHSSGVGIHVNDLPWKKY